MAYYNQWVMEDFGGALPKNTYHPLFAASREACRTIFRFLNEPIIAHKIIDLDSGVALQN
jgi:hypothetical protein